LRPAHQRHEPGGCNLTLCLAAHARLGAPTAAHTRLLACELRQISILSNARMPQGKVAPAARAHLHVRRRVRRLRELRPRARRPAHARACGHAVHVRLLVVRGPPGSAPRQRGRLRHALPPVRRPRSRGLRGRRRRGRRAVERVRAKGRRVREGRARGGRPCASRQAVGPPGRQARRGRGRGRGGELGHGVFESAYLVLGLAQLGGRLLGRGRVAQPVATEVLSLAPNARLAACDGGATQGLLAMPP